MSVLDKEMEGVVCTQGAPKNVHILYLLMAQLLLLSFRLKALGFITVHSVCAFLGRPVQTGLQADVHFRNRSPVTGARKSPHPPPAACRLGSQASQRGMRSRAKGLKTEGPAVLSLL